MTHVKTQNLRFIHTFNVGDWLSARVYSDVKGNSCACGGKFTGYQKLGDLPYPVCSSCNKFPNRFRIRASVIDSTGKQSLVFVRHNKSGRRLVSVAECLALIESIEEEKRMGTFDIRRYESEKTKKAYAFGCFIETYKDHHRRRMERGEITFKSLEGKISACNLLVKFFTDTDIARIGRPQIESFKNSFTDRLRARDLALGELKTILAYALDQGTITAMPKFAKIDRSKRRESIISAKDIRKVIDAVTCPQARAMFELLSIYPVRPSEMRALQWRDIQRAEKLVYFSRHFSGDVLLDGRKSSNRAVSFPLSKKLLDYLDTLPRPLDSSEFIFKRDGSFVKKAHIQYQWREAAKKAKVSHTAYELRHARLTDIAEKSGGNIVTMLKASGHTNSKTLLERYVRSENGLEEYFE